jgi:hypothetical protein
MVCLHRNTVINPNMFTINICHNAAFYVDVLWVCNEYQSIPETERPHLWSSRILLKATTGPSRPLPDAKTPAENLLNSNVSRSALAARLVPASITKAIIERVTDKMSAMIMGIVRVTSRTDLPDVQSHERSNVIKV